MSESAGIEEAFEGTLRVASHHRGHEGIGQAYTTAQAREFQDAGALRAATRIRAEVRDRFGVDVDNPGSHPGVDDA